MAADGKDEPTESPSQDADEGPKKTAAGKKGKTNGAAAKQADQNETGSSMAADGKDEPTESPSQDADEGPKEIAAVKKGKTNGAMAKRADQTETSQSDIDAVVKLLQQQDFGKASAKLVSLLKKQPDDPVLLHNLGVVYTEQERYAEAEEIFMQAFEAQKTCSKYNPATMFGLGTVLTEQGGMGKLLQAEMLFRDCLDMAIADGETPKGVGETYRSLTSLAENLGLQKRWKDAAEAYEQTYELASRMFGPDHATTNTQRAMMQRAQKLRKMQKYMRGALWTCTAAVPIVCAWLWKYAGAPSLGEIFQFSATGHNTTGWAP